MNCRSRPRNWPKAARFDAVICLGAVIRGATPHFEYISAEVSKGIASVGLETEVPVAFGVLTTDTIEQAIERAGTKSGNKGADAAMSAIEMVDLFKKIIMRLDGLLCQGEAKEKRLSRIILRKQNNPERILRLSFPDLRF